MKVRWSFRERSHTIMKFSYASHAILSEDALTFVRIQGKLSPKPLLCFSLDGFYSLFHRQMNYITLIYSLEYIIPKTKPVLYLYPFHLRQSFEDFDAYYAQLFWETEIFTTKEIPVSDAEFQILYRAKVPLPSIKTLSVLPDRKTASLENYANYLLSSSKDISLAYVTDDENLKAIINIIDIYNRSVCELYNIDYDIAKIKAYQTLHPLYLKTLRKLKWDESPLKGEIKI